MSEEDATRRKFLSTTASVTTLGLSGSPTGQEHQSASELEHLIVSKGQIHSEIVDKALASENSIDIELTRDEGDFVLLEQLKAADKVFETANAAHSGFYKGQNPQNSEMIVASGAVQTASTYESDVAKDVMQTFFKEFLRLYDEETDDQTEFERDSVHGDGFSDWHYQISILYQIEGLERLACSFEERIRLQFFDRTLLLTLVFAPAIQQLVDPLVDSFAENQREQHFEENQ